MNLNKFKIEKVPAPSTDWLIYGDIEDDDGTLLGTFGVNGTSVNQWWITQDETFQNDVVYKFAIVMAQQIAAGTAE